MDIVYQLEQMSSGIMLAFSTTSVNPNSRMVHIQKDLDPAFNGVIVFDLLLSNYGSNMRFLEVSARKGMIDTRSTKFIEPSRVRKKILKYANGFYRSNLALIENMQHLSKEDKDAIRLSIG
jgi:Antitoxin to bacterial toxin RNase LS or RnlA